MFFFLNIIAENNQDIFLHFFANDLTHSTTFRLKIFEPLIPIAFIFDKVSSFFSGENIHVRFTADGVKGLH
jgi:hypothetical protein